jgi:imidazolonepropionase-like amidohydrolase
VIEGARIRSVEKHQTHADAGVIDATNETVIPGLIEIHTHLSEAYGEALGRIFLAWGITTVRNPATNTFDAMEIRESVESGARVGPRLLTTGEPLDGTRIYYAGGTSLDEGGQLQLELQHAKDSGYDFIKTYVRLPDLMQKRVIDAAHAMGMPVTSHELYPAVVYGADGVEHIRGTSRRGYSPKVTALMRSYQDVIELLTASKMTLTPTIGIQGAFRLQTLRDASWIEDPRIQKLYPPAIAERWRGETRTPPLPAALEEAQRLVAPQERTIFQVLRGGGRVTAGTDAPINPYGLSLLMEMESYASSGLTPVEVLRTATIVSAEAMGVGADLGSVESGKLADLTFIDGDPLRNIKDLRHVTRVIKDGNLYRGRRPPSRPASDRAGNTRALIRGAVRSDGTGDPDPRHFSVRPAVEFRVERDRGRRLPARPRLQDQRVERPAVEVEVAHQAVGLPIPLGKRLEIEPFLDKLQDRRELEHRMRDMPVPVPAVLPALVSVLHPGRNNEKRHPRTEPEVVDDRRGHVVIEPAEVIPRQEDHRRVPVGPQHQGVELFNRPVFPQAHARGRMLAQP